MTQLIYFFSNLTTVLRQGTLLLGRPFIKSLPLLLNSMLVSHAFLSSVLFFIILLSFSHALSFSTLDLKASGESGGPDLETIILLLVQFRATSSFSAASRAEATEWIKALEQTGRVRRGMINLGKSRVPYSEADDEAAPRPSQSYVTFSFLSATFGA